MQQLVKVAAATGRTIDLEVQLEGARNSGIVRFREGSDGNVETNFKLLEPQQTSDPSDDERQIETSVECALPLLRRIGVHERGKTAIDKLAQELAKQIEREAGRVLQDLS